VRPWGVLHTLNSALPEQLAYVITTPRTRSSSATLHRRPAGRCATRSRPCATSSPWARRHRCARDTLDYESLLAAETGYDWPDSTNGSRGHVLHVRHHGQSKGVVYSHRSTFLHTMAITRAVARDQRADSVLSIVPMFHANAWAPLRGFMTGANDHAPAVPPAARCRPSSTGSATISAGVPTIWSDLLGTRRRTRSPVQSPDDHAGDGRPRQLIDVPDELASRCQGWA